MRPFSLHSLLFQLTLFYAGLRGPSLKDGRQLVRFPRSPLPRLSLIPLLSTARKSVTSRRAIFPERKRWRRPVRRRERSRWSRLRQEASRLTRSVPFLPSLPLLFWSHLLPLQWSARAWQKIGEVTDAVGSSRKQLYEGREYDYVFDIDLGGGGPNLKLPYNAGENSYAAAQRFLFAHELPLQYIDQIADFIERNAGGVTLGNQGGVDPYTGASSYASGSGGAGSTPQGVSGGFSGDPYTGSFRPPSSFCPPSAHLISPSQVAVVPLRHPLRRNRALVEASSLTALSSPSPPPPSPPFAKRPSSSPLRSPPTLRPPPSPSPPPSSPPSTASSPTSSRLSPPRHPLPLRHQPTKTSPSSIASSLPGPLPPASPRSTSRASSPSQPLPPVPSPSSCPPRPIPARARSMPCWP